MASYNTDLRKNNSNNNIAYTSSTKEEFRGQKVTENKLSVDIL